VKVQAGTWQRDLNRRISGFGFFFILKNVKSCTQVSLGFFFFFTFHDFIFICINTKIVQLYSKHLQFQISNKTNFSSPISTLLNKLTLTGNMYFQFLKQENSFPFPISTLLNKLTLTHTCNCTPDLCRKCEESSPRIPSSQKEIRFPIPIRAQVDD
jgi:hypothetical protein